ncbi:MAG: DM13 domain-containing protein [Bacteroidota bacterium]
MSNFRIGAAPINGIEVTWSSSDPEIAQVGASTGLVEALSPGKANITASAEGINSLPFEITVNSGDLSGTFTGLSGYSVSGSVTRTQDEDGNVVIQLEEDFSTQSGPGLYLYLGQSGTSGANSVSIDKLQARSGTQTYVIPSNINANDFDFVLIFCQPFNVVFGSAELQ